jgi:3-hydroxyacyl-CoA dehydrogenase
MRNIKKIAVLGSGIMGSGIACVLANAGYQVIMLDLPTPEGKNKNKVADDALSMAIKQKPAPLYHASFVSA